MTIHVPSGGTQSCAAREQHPFLDAAIDATLTTLAVAAKNVMASVPDYLLIETAFTAVQWIIVGPLTALAFRPPAGQELRAPKPAG